MKIQWCNREPCFPLPYHTLVTSERDFKAILKQYKLHTEGFLNHGCDATTHTYDWKNEIICFVCVPKEYILKRHYLDLTGLLVHEAMHVFQRYCDCIGEKAPSREFGAYALERITKNLLHLAMKVRK